MSKWTISANGEQGPVFIAEALAGVISIHIPTPDPVIVTVEKAEEIRAVLAAAIGSVQTEAPR